MLKLSRVLYLSIKHIVTSSMAQKSSSKRIGIYNLDENNHEIITGLTNCLTKTCSVNYYKELESCDKLSIGDAISTTLAIKSRLPSYTIVKEDLDLLKFENLTALLYVTGSAKINHLVAQKSPSFFKYILS